jgi:hypothetical protein
MGQRPIHELFKSSPGKVDRATKKPIEGLSICHDRGERLPPYPAQLAGLRNRRAIIMQLTRQAQRQPAGLRPAWCYYLWRPGRVHNRPPNAPILDKQNLVVRFLAELGFVGQDLCCAASELCL